MKLSRISANRKQTLVFLEVSKHVKGVTLITKLDVHPNRMKLATSILIKSVSTALQEIPEFNCMVKYGSQTKLICPNEINARITISDENQGVLSFQIKNTDKKDIDTINNEIKQKKQRGVENNSIDNKIMLIQKLPLWIGFLLSKLFLRTSSNQFSLFGSFTVTSFGKQSQKVCIPISGSTFTFTMGSPLQTSCNVYQSNLVMVFDHRVLDGIQAAKFLNKITEFFKTYYWNESK